MNEQIVWKEHPIYTCYEVSSDGQVRNKITERLLTPKKDRDGYYNIHLRQGIEHKNGKWITVHRLVAQTFLEPVEGKTLIDHIDRNRTNNNVSNLRYVNAKENSNNRKPHSFSLTKKVPIVLLSKEGDFIRRFDNVQQASKIMGVAEVGIRNNVHGNKPGYTFGTFVREQDYLEFIEKNS